MDIVRIVTSKKCISYLESRGLEKQFLKAVEYILQ